MGGRSEPSHPFSSGEAGPGERCGGVGVIVPLYNSATTIGETLCSLQSQTLGGWRCFVVNDGSTDAGPRIVESFCKADKRFTLIDIPNSGPAAARNRGIDAAIEDGCEYLHFLDADDWMVPRAMEWLVDAAGETGAGYAGYEFSDAEGHLLARQSPISAAYAGLDEELEWNRAAIHARLIHREVLGDLRFDEHARYIEDYDLWLRLAIRGVRFKAVERIVGVYRMRPSSLSKRFDRMCEHYQRVIANAMERAADAGWGPNAHEPGRRVDLSHTRLTRVVGQAALGYATMAALLDGSPEKHIAVGILRKSLHAGRFTPPQLAQAACTAILFGTCRSQDIDGTNERHWMPPLMDWWKRCVCEGWLDTMDLDTCVAEIAAKVVHPDTIADAMLDACPKGRPIGIVGIDKFARRLARRAAARNMPVTVVDTISHDDEAALLEPHDTVRIVRNHAAMPQEPPGTWLITPGSAGSQWPGIERRLFTQAGVLPGIVRWVDTHARLASLNLDFLHNAIARTNSRARRLIVS